MILIMRGVKKKKEESGAVLIVALMVATVLLLSSVPFLFKLSAQYKNTDRSFKSYAALNLAEAGIERTIWELNFGDISTWAGDSNLRTKTISSVQAAGGAEVGDIEINVTNPEGETSIVEATGKISYTDLSEISKTIQVILTRGDPPLLSAALFANEKIHFKKNTLFDSYDSRDGEYGGSNINQLGNIGTNSTEDNCVDIDGNTDVYGNIASGPGSDLEDTMDIDIGSNVYGDLYALSELKELPSLSPPEGLPVIDDVYKVPSNTSETLSVSGIYTDYHLEANSTVTVSGDVVLYILHDFRLHTNTVVDIPEGSSLTVYIDHKLDPDANSKLNNISKNPINLRIIGTELYTGNTNFDSNVEFHGVLYAPNSKVVFKTNSDFYGAIVSREFELDSNAEFHYDEALSLLDIEGNERKYTVKSWQEKIN